MQTGKEREHPHCPAARNQPSKKARVRVRLRMWPFMLGFSLVVPWEFYLHLFTLSGQKQRAGIKPAGS